MQIERVIKADTADEIKTKIHNFIEEKMLKGYELTQVKMFEESAGRTCVVYMESPS